MSLGAVILIYVFAILVGLPLIWRVTRGLGAKAQSSAIIHLFRIALRSLALSLVFAPTAIVAGYTGFVLPASFVLAWWLLTTQADFGNREIQNQIRWSISSLTF